jgi:hypothetical protein
MVINNEIKLDMLEACENLMGPNNTENSGQNNPPQIQPQPVPLPQEHVQEQSAFEYLF